MADDHEDHSWILDDELAALFSSPKKAPTFWRHFSSHNPKAPTFWRHFSRLSSNDPKKPRHSGGFSSSKKPHHH